MAHSLGGGLPWSETFSVGIDTCTSVDEKDYQVPFAFTGKLNKLTVKLGPKQDDCRGEGGCREEDARQAIATVAAN